MLRIDSGVTLLYPEIFSNKRNDLLLGLRVVKFWELGQVYSAWNPATSLLMLENHVDVLKSTHFKAI